MCKQMYVCTVQGDRNWYEWAHVPNGSKSTSTFLFYPSSTYPKGTKLVRPEIRRVGRNRVPEEARTTTTTTPLDIMSTTATTTIHAPMYNIITARAQPPQEKCKRLEG